MSNEPGDSVSCLQLHCLPFVRFRIEDPQVGQVTRYGNDREREMRSDGFSVWRCRPTLHSCVMEPAVEDDVLLPERHSSNVGYNKEGRSVSFAGVTRMRKGLTYDHCVQWVPS
jgi:hypothetical protein